MFPGFTRRSLLGRRRHRFELMVQQACDDGLDINDLQQRRKLVASIEINVLPCHRRDLPQYADALVIPSRFLPGDELGDQVHVVADDAVGHQPAAFAPDLLILLGRKPQFAKIGIRHRPPQLVILLPAIERPLDILSQRRRVHILQQVPAADDPIILPEGLTGRVLARVGIQLSHNNVLTRGFECQGGENPQQIVPFCRNQGRVQLVHGRQEQITILPGKLKARQAGPDFLGQILEAWRKHVAKQVEQGKIDLIAPVGV